MTGGAGFIGSHVVEALLDHGVEVRVLDSLDPAAHGPRSTEGPTAPHVDPRVQLLVADLGDAAAVAAATAGVDAVCHQAAKVGLGVDFGDARGYVTSNDVGTVALLEALWRRHFRGRLVLASSMVVYGEGQARCPDHGVVAPAPREAADLDAGCFEPRCGVARCRQWVAWVAVEESAPLDPRNLYAATKLHQEHLCQLWGRESGATVVALRYHNVYGPRMPRDTPYAGVASIFRSALAAGRPPRVFEDGGQTRDFVHVRDVARANLLALTGGAVISGPLNIASGHPHTVGEMAVALAAASREVGRAGGVGRVGAGGAGAVAGARDGRGRRGGARAGGHGTVASRRCPPHRGITGSGRRGAGLSGRGGIRGGNGGIRSRAPTALGGHGPIAAGRAGWARSALRRAIHYPFSVTPAESKVAISPKIRALASMTGSARQAPLPSPNRIPRSSRAESPRWASAAAAPGSADR